MIAFPDLFRRPRPNPGVAAAVLLLSQTSLPLRADRLDSALRSVAPQLTAAECTAWVAALAGPLCRTGITTPRCLAAFLGQSAVESAGFRELEENLNYTAARLCEVWPSRFPTAASAEPCARQPEALANRIYANRMGNGNEASGDGWRFRGRGLIQITGRAAYQSFARSMNMTLDQAVEYAGTRAGAVDSAVWFWTANQLNTLANIWSVDLISRKINGGTAGAAERNRLCETALRVIGA